MLSNEIIIITTSGPLRNYMKRRPTHYAEILAIANRVINISSASMKNYLKFKNTRPWEEKIFFRLPGNRYKFVQGLNKWLYSRFLKKVICKLPQKPILWHFFSGDFDLVKNLPNKVSILEICDDTPEFFVKESETYKKVMENEDRMSRSVDIVFTISDYLREKKKKLRPDIKVVRNGVVFRDFSLVPELGRIVGEELFSVKPPIVGYTGAVSHWLDFNLAELIAEALPDVNFVYIGRISPDQQTIVQRLNLKPNIYFLGERPYESLPHYLKYFDVAQIPFVINKLTFSVNPIKLYEYLAAGLRVVSTPMPEVVRYAEKGIVETAKESREYCRIIQGMLGEKGRDHIRICQEIAEQNSWRARVESACVEIQDKLIRCAGL